LNLGRPRSIFFIKCVVWSVYRYKSGQYLSHVALRLEQPLKSRHYICPYRIQYSIHLQITFHWNRILSRIDIEWKLSSNQIAACSITMRSIYWSSNSAFPIYIWKSMFVESCTIYGIYGTQTIDHSLNTGMHGVCWLSKIATAVQTANQMSLNLDTIQIWLNGNWRPMIASNTHCRCANFVGYWTQHLLKPLVQYTS
jgi:hypothetical protein